MRVAVLAGLVLLLEVLCRTGVIDPLALLPPSTMVAAMMEELTSGDATAPMVQTFTTVGLSWLCAVISGTVAGALLHAAPRAPPRGGPAAGVLLLGPRPSCSTRCWWRCWG